MHASEIIEYEDYRKFLKHRLKQIKEKNPKISYQYLARKIGSTNSYLKHILEGRGNVGLDRISKVAKAFSLTKFESQYFSFLVIRHLTKDSLLKESITQIIASMKYLATQPKYVGHIDEPSHSFTVSHWLYEAILELMNFSGFQSDPEWIRSKLLDANQVSLTDIQLALKNLCDRGITEYKNGVYSKAQGTSNIASPFHFEDVKNYRGGFEKTISVLENPGIYVGYRFFVGSFAIGVDDEKKILNAVDTFRETVLKIAAETKNPQLVISVNSAAFNLIKSTAE